MKNKGLLSQISLTGQDGLDWSISQKILLVNDWLTSHQFLTLPAPVKSIIPLRQLEGAGIRTQT